MVAGCGLTNFNGEVRNSLIFTSAIRNSFQIDGEMRHEKTTTTTTTKHVLYPRTRVLTVFTKVFTLHTSQVSCFYIYKTPPVRLDLQPSWESGRLILVPMWGQGTLVHKTAEKGKGKRKPSTLAPPPSKCPVNGISGSFHWFIDEWLLS